MLFLAGSWWKALASQHCYHDRQPEQLLVIVGEWKESNLGSVKRQFSLQ